MSIRHCLVGWVKALRNPPVAQGGLRGLRPPYKTYRPFRRGGLMRRTEVRWDEVNYLLPRPTIGCHAFHVAHEYLVAADGQVRPGFLVGDLSLVDQVKLLRGGVDEVEHPFLVERQD